MLVFIKKNYYYICLSFVYSLLASLVYGIWSYSAWHLWYVTAIIILVIFGVGSLICYLWIKSENKIELSKQEDTIVQ